MRKIAFIIDAGKRASVFVRVSGIIKRIQEVTEDINLYLFRSAGTWSLDVNYNLGEYNIFRLPDFSDFDAIILDVNTLYQREKYGYSANACEYIIQAAKESGKPVVSFANNIDGCYYVGIDNYASMRSMISHIYEVHQCRQYWFIMGPNDNYENRLREQAIRDYLKEHHISFRENQFYHESFESSCGDRGFKKLLKTHGELPDAVVCANDNIAIGVCKAAEEKGYRIPQDFLLTGFDNYGKASFFSPRITTVDQTQQQEQIGKECVDLLLRIWQGEAVERLHYVNTQCLFWDSCGCNSTIVVNPALYTRQKIYDEIEQAEFEEDLKMLEYELLHCENVDQIYEAILQGMPSLKCDALYLVMDKNIDDFRTRIDMHDIVNFHDAEEAGFHIYGYPEQMNVVGARRKLPEITIERDQINGLFPFFDSAKGGNHYLFMPLHFSERTVGYLAIANDLDVLEKQDLDKLATCIMVAMESLHRNEKLEYINEELAACSVKDAMTGYYNRLGYQHVACRTFSEKRSRKENLTVLFIDMDRLKYMNDTFGHECGDAAIKTIAAAILHHCPSDSIPVRMGGDEFLILMDWIPDSEIMQIIQNIRAEIRSQSKTPQIPCALSISIGCVGTDMNSDRELDDYVREADAVMYQEKMAGNKSRRV